MLLQYIIGSSRGRSGGGGGGACCVKLHAKRHKEMYMTCFKNESYADVFCLGAEHRENLLVVKYCYCTMLSIAFTLR